MALLDFLFSLRTSGDSSSQENTGTGAPRQELYDEIEFATGKASFEYFNHIGGW